MSSSSPVVAYVRPPATNEMAVLNLEEDLQVAIACAIGCTPQELGIQWLHLTEGIAMVTLGVEGGLPRLVRAAVEVENL